MSFGTRVSIGNSFSNVVANGTATNSITPGRTLETFRMQLGGTALTIAMLSRIKVKANGKAIVDVTGSQLDSINKYMGYASDAGFLDLNFKDSKMLSNLDRSVGAFDTSLGIASLTTEIAIAGATAPTLTPILVESAQQKDASGAAQPYAPVFTKIVSFPFSVSTGGKLTVRDIPFGAQNGCLIKRAHFFHTGNMTDIVVKQDGIEFFNQTQAQNEFMQKLAGRVPQANVFTVDFTLDGVIGKALNTRDAKTLDWLVGFSAADNGTIVLEMLDTLANN